MNGHQLTREKTNIRQGDIYWICLADPDGIQPDYAHPYVVIQDDLLNRSRIDTIVVCALTSNLHQISAPGNVLLDQGEANLPEQSVVVVSKISTVFKSQLGEYIGSLEEKRIRQILNGILFLQRSIRQSGSI
jgi:mRNA interferase MazF